MKLEILADVLTKAGFGKLGGTLFIHNMPNVSKGILFRLPLQGIKIDYEIRERFKHSLQVIVRDGSTDAVARQSEAVLKALTLSEQGFPGMYVTYIRPDTTPIIYPRSEQSAEVEASINFDCCYTLL